MSPRAKKKPKPGPESARGLDAKLVTVVMLLAVWGLVMMYSASAIWAYQNLNDTSYFLKKQIVWLIAGIGAMTLSARVHHERLREWVWPAMLLLWALLVAVLFAPAVGGAHRWLRFGPFGFQPSEVAKLVLIVFLADHLDRRQSKLARSWKALVVPMGVIGVTLGLILLEPDLGNPALLTAVCFGLFFLAGAPLKWLAVPALAATPLLLYELLKYDYRRQRLLSFFNPEADVSGTGYQVAQSLVAVGSGGWFGKGWGASKLKMLYLPTPHTDFIFPIVGEELGLIGALGVALAFAALGWIGFKIARRAGTLFGSLLAAGITMTIVLQAYFNICVTLGLVPAKGISLPFFSFGGSSLLVLLAGVGILINVHRESNAEDPA